MIFDLLIVGVIVVGGVMAVRRFTRDLRSPSLDDQMRAERASRANSVQRGVETARLPNEKPPEGD